ncbi:MAG: hypothetical protein SF097_16560 [Acidobacteriota bacterium]|nr:hypothetical protein [Acidobacteriota bacterium]
MLDQYLQVAQIALRPEGVRIELRLIPGVQVSERICALIDADGDGQITTAEEQTYARRVLQDIALTLNGLDTPLTLSKTQFPAKQEMREGLGTIRLTFVAASTFDAAGYQQLHFRNSHQPELGAYLVNALVPETSEIKISEQARDPLQREVRLSFQITPVNTGWQPGWKSMLMVCLCLLLFFSHRLASNKAWQFRPNRGKSAESEATVHSS